MLDTKVWLRRGTYPVEIAGAPSWAPEIPGVSPDGQRATLDGYCALARILGWSHPEVPAPPKLEDERLRPYQKEAAGFLATHPFAMLDLPMQSGKTPATIAAAESLPWANRILCVVPRLAKYVWGSHGVEWFRDGRPVVVYEGRAFQTGRVVCPECRALGWVGEEERCPSCKGRGARILHNEEAMALLLEEKLVAITSYDGLVSQKDADGRGVIHDRGAGLGASLRGWADLIVADEAHRLRGRASWVRNKRTDKFELKTVARVEAFRGVASPRGDELGRPWVWMLSGTFVYAYTRDLYGALDLGTGGVAGRPKQFDIRYCEGVKGIYGWENTGRSALAETELPQRLAWYRFKRNRSELAADLPLKQRSPVWLDVPDKVQDQVKRAFIGSAAEEKGAAKALADAARIVSRSKWDAVLEMLSTQIMEGERIVVFLFHKDSAKAFFDQLVKLAKKPELRERKPGLWHVDGDTPELERFRIAERFRAWTLSAGVIVATIDSMTESLSLAGASYVHFVDLHWSASALLQAEDRPNRVGVSALGVSRIAVWYWLAKVASDRRMLNLVLEKARTADRILADEAQAGLGSSLGGPTETDAEKAERLFQAIRIEVSDDYWDE